MTEPKSKLKKGIKLITTAKQGKFFHVRHARLSAQVYPQHALAFKKAADMIIDSVLSGNEKRYEDRLVSSDGLAFPVLYLYRHGLELMLKDLVLLGIRTRFFGEKEVERITDEKKGIYGRHELCPLWTKAKRLILHSYPEDDGAQAAEAMVNEFHQIDMDGQVLRYDRKKGTWTLRRYEDLPDTIDIASLRANAGKLFDYLDDSYAGVRDWWAEQMATTEGG